MSNFMLRLGQKYCRGCKCRQPIKAGNGFPGARWRCHACKTRQGVTEATEAHPVAVTPP